MDGDAKRLGRAFRALRQEYGYSQESVATLADVVPSYVCRLELGQFRAPGYDTLERLARAFRLTDASALMRRLQAIDAGSHPADAEVARISDLADGLVVQLHAEILAVPETERARVVREALEVIRSNSSSAALV